MQRLECYGACLWQQHQVVPSNTVGLREFVIEHLLVFDLMMYTRTMQEEKEVHKRQEGEKARAIAKMQGGLKKR